MINILVSSLKLVCVDIIGDMVYWPIWWYTTGLKDMLKFVWLQERNTWRMLSLGIWLKSMFTPMFGDRSLAGRAISLVMRMVVLIWKMAWFLIWTAIILCWLLIWILAPVGVIWMVVRQF